MIGVAGAPRKRPPAWPRPLEVIDMNDAMRSVLAEEVLPGDLLEVCGYWMRVNTAEPSRFEGAGGWVPSVRFVLDRCTELSLPVDRLIPVRRHDPVPTLEQGLRVVR